MNNNALIECSFKKVFTIVDYSLNIISQLFLNLNTNNGLIIIFFIKGIKREKEFYNSANDVIPGIFI